MIARLQRPKQAVARLSKPFQDFFALQASGAIVLLIATVAALILANSSLADQYFDFWHIEVGFTVGAWEFSETLLHWIDDGLMALFFFVVGLEIKREFVAGELSSARTAALPIIAAMGGMVLPALIYLAINFGGEGQAGWGIPMATDIAFALGILALLGSRIPAGLKIFLTALAIVDDIGAVLVIAIFYTSEIHYGWLLVGLALWLVLVAFNFLGIDQPLPYFLVGAVIWFAFLHSGVHATIAGILVAFTIPSKARTKPLDFVNFARDQLTSIEKNEVPGAHTLEDPSQQKCAMRIQEQARHVSAPLQRLEHGLQPFTTYLVLPLFALANAGVTVRGYDIGELLLEPVSVGIFFGLIVGKTFGIGGATWIAVKLRLAELPANVNWGHVVGAGMLGGVGFTMSLFISNLAFRSGLLQVEAKLAILVTSVLAGLLGYFTLRWVTSRSSSPPEAETATETV